MNENSNNQNISSQSVPTKKSGKGLVAAIIVILLLVIGVLVYKCFFKYEPGQSTKKDMLKCFNETGIEQTNCMTKHINEGNEYTRKTLLSNGFSEINTNIDLGKNISTDSEKLKKIASANLIEIVSAFDDKKLATIELNGNIATLNLYDQQGVSVKQQTINNVMSMIYEKDIGGGYDRYAFLIDSNHNCYKLHLNQSTDVNKINDKQFDNLLFEKVTTVSNVYEVYYLFNYSETDHANISYLMKTTDNKFKYIEDGKEYTENTYKALGNNVKIMNNREIYLNDKIESYKYKMEYSDVVFSGKINYVLVSDNYLYNDKLELVYDKKVSSILIKDYYVVTIFEDGKNIATNNYVVNF